MPTAERYHQYEILRRDNGSLWELGRGSMGITYKAYDTNLRFTVALKVINSAYLESDTARQRFLREARAAAALRHSIIGRLPRIARERVPTVPTLRKRVEMCHAGSRGTRLHLRIA